MELSLVNANELSSKISDRILEQIKDILASKDTEEILTRDSVAKMFGVSKVTVHDWMHKGILTYYKMNGRTYFKKSEVLHAMKQVKVRRKITE